MIALADLAYKFLVYGEHSVHCEGRSPLACSCGFADTMREAEAIRSDADPTPAGAAPRDEARQVKSIRASAQLGPVSRWETLALCDEVDNLRAARDAALRAGSDEASALDVERMFCAALLPEGPDVINRVTARFCRARMELEIEMMRAAARAPGREP